MQTGSQSVYNNIHNTTPQDNLPIKERQHRQEPDSELAVLWSVALSLLYIHWLTTVFSYPFFSFTDVALAVSSGHSQQIWSAWAMQLDMRPRLDGAAWCFLEIQMTDTYTCFSSTLERSIDDTKSWGSCRLAPAQWESTVLAGSPIGLIFPLKVNHCAPQPRSFCKNLKTSTH